MYLYGRVAYVRLFVILEVTSPICCFHFEFYNVFVKIQIGRRRLRPRTRRPICVSPNLDKGWGTIPQLRAGPSKVQSLY